MKLYTFVPRPMLTPPVVRAATPAPDLAHRVGGHHRTEAERHANYCRWLAEDPGLANAVYLHSVALEAAHQIIEQVRSA